MLGPPCNNPGIERASREAATAGAIEAGFPKGVNH